MKIKNWIEWTQQMSKIWEKNWTRTYCKFLLLPFKCESQSGPENQMIKEMSSHCDKNSAHNFGGKYRWIPLLSFYLSHNNYAWPYCVKCVLESWVGKYKLKFTWYFNGHFFHNFRWHHTFSHKSVNNRKSSRRWRVRFVLHPKRLWSRSIE